MKHCDHNCNQGRDCNCGECAPLSTWESIGAAIVIGVLSILSVLSIIGGSTWLYATLEAL